MNAPPGYVIRPAVPADSAAILEIYRYYIENTAISFETETPALDAFAARVEAIAARYPFLVCVCAANGAIAGYAYAAPHGERAAYRYSVNVSVYVDARHQRQGIASALYSRLFDALHARGYYTAFAAYTADNTKSAALHARCGFAYAGRFSHAGYKFGQWHDLIWVQRALRSYAEPPGAWNEGDA